MNISEYENLPGWVWELLAALDRYEEEHPVLFRELPDGSYDQEPCFATVAHPIIPAEAPALSRLLQSVNRTLANYERVTQ